MSRCRIDGRRVSWIPPLLATVLMVVGAAPALPATIFSPGQPESSDADAGTNGQWDSFGASSGRSSFTSASNSMRVSSAAGDAVSLSRTSDFSPAPQAALCPFNLTLSHIGPGRISDQALRLGSKSATANAGE